MKTLTTNKRDLAVAWMNLQNLKPSDIPNIPQMEQILEIIDNLKEVLPEYAKLREDGLELGRKTRTGLLTGEELANAQKEFNDSSALIDEKGAESEIEAEFEDAEFNTLFDLFADRGKNWFGSMRDFLAFRKALDETNQQKKGSKESKDDKGK